MVQNTLHKFKKSVFIMHVQRKSSWALYRVYDIVCAQIGLVFFVSYS